MDIRITKTFANREELDQYVKGRFGDDASKNLDISLEMAEPEMQALLLDESTTVHGVKVVAVSENEDVAVKPKGVVLGRGVISKRKKARSKN